MKKIFFHVSILCTMFFPTFAQDCQYSSALLVSKVKVINPMILEAMDTCLESITRCPFYQDNIPSQVVTVFDTQRSLYRFKISPQNNIESSIEYLMMKKYVSPEWIPYYCDYNGVVFLFVVEDSTLFESEKSGEYIPYYPEAKYYALTNEKDSISYEKRSYLAEDINAYVYCKIEKGSNLYYTIYSRPCPNIIDMPILIDTPTKCIFLKGEQSESETNLNGGTSGNGTYDNSNREKSQMSTTVN